jgi:hypothetical protein
MSSSQDKAEKDKTIEYFVNGEPQTTTNNKLKVSEILTLAGFVPASDYRLKRDDGGKELGNDDEEPIHKDERFTATHNAPTPTS